MTQPVRYYISGFILKIFGSAYLVEVKRANGETGCYENFQNLSDWVFCSRHSIWVTAEKGPIHLRAARGEKIEQESFDLLCKERKWVATNIVIR